MTPRVTWALIAGSLALAACGKTVKVGDEKTGAGAAGGTDGTGATGGSSTDPDGGIAGASGTAGGGEAGTSGASGSTGTGGAGEIDASNCKLPRPPPAPNPTTAERERAELVRAFCTNLADHGCIDRYEALSGVTAQASGCSASGKVLACEMDELYLYVKLVPQDCDDEWRAALRCGASAEYAQDCKYPVSLVAPMGPREPGQCDAEALALETCWSTSPEQRSLKVTGARTSCRYYRSAQQGPSCQVDCDLPSGAPGFFHSTCNGPAGLPLECDCMVNGSYIMNYGSDEDGNFFASDCQHAAQLMADGFCVNRLDCCFTQTQGLDGGSQCFCTSEPLAPGFGQPTCEALATSRAGQVVDICPKYKTEGN